jgi:hypothetical protein
MTNHTLGPSGKRDAPGDRPLDAAGACPLGWMILSIDNRDGPDQAQLVSLQVSLAPGGTPDPSRGARCGATTPTTSTRTMRKASNTQNLKGEPQ